MTRRDIDKLHDLGQARKVYGGISAANALDRLAARPYDENRDIAVEAKRAIAERASALISDGVRSGGYTPGSVAPLWRARVSPWRLVGDTTDGELRETLGHAAALMRDSTKLPQAAPRVR